MKRGVKQKTVTGTGWCGLWNDGTPGWFMPRHIADNDSEPISEDQWRNVIKDGSERLYRCRIAVSLVTDKNGRYITRKGAK